MNARIRYHKTGGLGTALNEFLGWNNGVLNDALNNYPDILKHDMAPNRVPLPAHPEAAAPVENRDHAPVPASPVQPALLPRQRDTVALSSTVSPPPQTKEPAPVPLPRPAPEPERVHPAPKPRPPISNPIPTPPSRPEPRADPVPLSASQPRPYLRRLVRATILLSLCSSFAYIAWRWGPAGIATVRKQWFTGGSTTRSHTLLTPQPLSAPSVPGNVTQGLADLDTLRREDSALLAAWDTLHEQYGKMLAADELYVDWLELDRLLEGWTANHVDANVREAENTLKQAKAEADARRPVSDVATAVQSIQQQLLALRALPLRIDALREKAQRFSGLVPQQTARQRRLAEQSGTSGNAHNGSALTPPDARTLRISEARRWAYDPKVLEWHQYCLRPDGVKDQWVWRLNRLRPAFQTFATWYEWMVNPDWTTHRTDFPRTPAELSDTARKEVIQRWMEFRALAAYRHDLFLSDADIRKMPDVLFLDSLGEPPEPSEL